MKRKLQYIFGVLCILAVCMIAGILFSVRTREEQDTREQQAAKELQMYTEFLEGKRSVDKWMITDLAMVTGEPDKREAVEYTMFDCDGDKLPELHVRTVKDYHIIDCGGDELYAWKYLYPQTEILNNGDFLYTYIGGAPLHYDYKYFSVDSHGEDDEVIRFSCYDDNGDGVFDEKDLYLGDDAEEISYKQWLKWKKKYLGIGTDKIVWKEIGVSAVKTDEAEKDVSGDQEPVDNIRSNNNTDAYTILKREYEKIDFTSEFIPGEGKYNEEFLRLIRGEIPYVDSQSREKLTYYYYDADGDGVSELGISDEVNYIYLFDYDEEQKRITLWKDLSSTWYRLMGTQKIYWNNGGTNILYSGVNQEGEEVEARFYSDEIINEDTKEAEIIYMVAYPKGIDQTALEEIKSQAYYENQAYYFRVTQEQYDELTNRYFMAETESREKSKEVGYSYQEIQELLQVKQEKDYSGSETYPYEVEQKTFSFSVDQGKEYHIPYVRVSGLQDKELQWKINHTLWENACWVLDCAELGDHLYSIFKDSLYMQITGVYKCANYLSVVYEGLSERGIEGHIAYAIVVDMLTGERVLMSDMVEKPSALKELLLHYFDGDDRIMRLFITEEVADKIIFYGSLTEKETVQNNVQSEDGEVDSVSWLFENASFYMTEEAFVILPGAICFEPLFFPWEEVEGVISRVYSN